MLRVVLANVVAAFAGCRRADCHIGVARGRRINKRPDAIA
ncbi:putative lipoprotein [Ahrensia sp. R2A130]|nr:putative lipoprotein [Ahrensia sp. R2A130]